VTTRRDLTTFSFALRLLLGVLLVSACALAGSKPGYLTEELHQTYSVTPNSRVSLSNINGPVHISSWDRNEVRVDAVKYAHSQERLDEAKIEVKAGSDSVSIRTRYPQHDTTWNSYGHDNPASVEYTLTVPRGARLSDIELINGDLDIQGVSGEVTASCINGELKADGLTGRSHLSTINGPLNASFSQLASQSVEVSSVNGSVSLTLPSDVGAEVAASTVHGEISNDFGLKQARHQWVGGGLHGTLGNGGAKITISNVNGEIEIHHAKDGKAISPAKSDNGDSDDDEI